MKKNNRYVVAMILALLVVTCCLSGCNTKFVVTTGVGSKQVLKAAGESCSVGEAKLYLTTLTNEYKSFYGYDMWEGSDESGDAALESYVKDCTMGRIQNVFCMYLLAKDQGITLTEDETGLIEDAAKEYYDSLTDDEKKYLGVKEKDVEKAYTRYTLAEKLYDTMTADADFEVSDNEARIMDAQIIFTSDSAKAVEIQTKLSEGSDFATIASAYTELSSISQSISRDDYPQEVEDAAFALEDGDTSTCIQTDDGYYFVKCISKLDEEKTEENRTKIMEEKRESAFDETYHTFVDGLNLQVNDKLWDKLTVNVDETITTTSFFEVYNSYFAQDS